MQISPYRLICDGLKNILSLEKFPRQLRLSDNTGQSSLPYFLMVRHGNRNSLKLASWLENTLAHVYVTAALADFLEPVESENTTNFATRQRS